ncbi:hypothetical protein F4818DRAFT_358824 [Hypoxylon cercidicola]|nr:hypothetical protein F4818DRAFT_358824 [Hypoxylon cercidicola]
MIMWIRPFLFATLAVAINRQPMSNSHLLDSDVYKVEKGRDIPHRYVKLARPLRLISGGQRERQRDLRDHDHRSRRALPRQPGVVRVLPLHRHGRGHLVFGGF